MSSDSFTTEVFFVQHFNELDDCWYFYGNRRLVTLLQAEHELAYVKKNRPRSELRIVKFVIAEMIEPTTSNQRIITL